jgi:hypothetical protein
MTAPWQKLGWSTLFAAVFLGVPALAHAQTDSQKLDQILNQMKADREELKEEIRKLRTETGLNVAAAQERINRLTEDLKRLGEDVKGLQRDLEKMRSDGSSPSIRQAGSINLPTQPASTGRVRMRNVFHSPVRIRLNGRDYNLDPGETNEVCVPLGEFTYEVVDIQPPRTEVLTPDKAFNIVVYTR